MSISTVSVMYAWVIDIPQKDLQIDHSKVCILSVDVDHINVDIDGVYSVYMDYIARSTF